MIQYSLPRMFVLAHNLQFAGMQDMSLAEKDINSRLVAQPDTSRPVAVICNYLLSFA